MRLLTHPRPGWHTGAHGTHVKIQRGKYILDDLHMMMTIRRLFPEPACCAYFRPAGLS